MIARRTGELDTPRVERFAPTALPKCDQYAPTMRSLCVPSVCKRVRGSIDAPTMGQPYARYALSMCPLCVEGVFGFNPLAQSAVIVRPRCAHCVLPMCFNRFGVQWKGPQRGH